ncbi:MAG: FMN-binding negative transcriptional regulator [Candidatus Kapabacteria bacterium]|nr:FMN-binding negative transcriptional regulator [Candidatus Kapabacteria bacterium]
MYIPSQYQQLDKSEIVKFMRAFPFATLITAKDNLPYATHIPIIIQEDKNLVLLSHIAKANDQWMDFEESDALIIFQQPNAPISPKYYTERLNVPTWNYIAVHCYGTIEIIEDDIEIDEILELMINEFTPEFKEKWYELPADYIRKMKSGIVTIKIDVYDTQAKEKLSQGKPHQDKVNIIEDFKNSEDSNKKLIADYMEQRLF